MRRIVIALTVALTLTVPAPGATAAPQSYDINAATFTSSTPPASAPLGVSPEVFLDAPTGTYYLITTSMPPTQYRSTDGITWTPVGNQLPMGIDWSIVQEGPASYRLYYAEMTPPAPGSSPAAPCTPGSKYLRYATSSDLINWTTQPGVLLGDVGCGVPHVMKTSTGNYFLYFNKKDPVYRHGVRVATSSDGLSWNELPGIVANDTELVDPAPIEMPDGTFIMIGSTTGGAKGFQELQILNSTDAINWNLRATPLYSLPGVSVLDPSVELINNQLRVWFGYAPGGDHNSSRIATGTVEFTDTPTTVPATTAKAKAGKKCTKKGAVSGKLVCKKKKGKLVWVRR
ncbi:MAG: hypothetical protein K9G12_01515 [Candidatus Nanopelagicales bacterium]|nr:hypothetical protein [Candidatus Nanopelagicales bacterium]MCF8538941.1 hypothetical protein [Candidatus Nanopelagicales bacterium]